MLKLVPALLVTLVYVAFRIKATRDRRLSKGLVMEALAFAFCAHVVMYVYRKFYLHEGMTTFGETCPNGYEMVPDPVNVQQQTCKPVGHQTASAEVGFRGGLKK